MAVMLSVSFKQSTSLLQRTSSLTSLLPVCGSLGDLSKLQGLLDLEEVILVAGFGEVGPWGSSRTRWEMDVRGQFTIEGCIGMAWAS